MRHTDELSLMVAALCSCAREAREGRSTTGIDFRLAPAPGPCWCERTHAPLDRNRRLVYLVDKWSGRRWVDYGTSPVWPWLEPLGLEAVVGVLEREAPDLLDLVAADVPVARAHLRAIWGFLYPSSHVH